MQTQERANCQAGRHCLHIANGKWQIKVMNRFLNSTGITGIVWTCSKLFPMFSTIRGHLEYWPYGAALTRPQALEINWTFISVIWCKYSSLSKVFIHLSEPRRSTIMRRGLENLEEGNLENGWRCSVREEKGWQSELGWVTHAADILWLLHPPFYQGVGSDGLGNVNPLYGFLKPDKTPGLTALTTPHTGLNIILKMAGTDTNM